MSNFQTHRLATATNESATVFLLRPPDQPIDARSLLARCVGLDSSLSAAFTDLRECNAQALRASPNTIVVIEGRHRHKKFGYLGDAVQSSCTIQPLQQHLGSDRVSVFSSNPDLIDGFPLPDCPNVTPQSFAGNDRYWQSISGYAGLRPVLIPTLARFASVLHTDVELPSHFQEGDDGDCRNVFCSGGEVCPRHVIIKKRFWSDGQLHLTEALRVWLWLFGADGHAPMSPLLVKGTHIPSLQRYSLSDGRVRKAKGGCVPATIGHRIPLIIFPDTEGKPCKLWPTAHWGQMFEELMKLGLAGHIHCLLSQPIIPKPNRPLPKAYVEIRTHAARSGLSVACFAEPLERLVKMIRWMCGEYRDVIALGLDSMGAAHLCPALGTHAVVIGHRSGVYGGDPFYSAPLSYLGKKTSIVLPPAGSVDAAMTRPSDVANAIASIVHSIVD